MTLLIHGYDVSTRATMEVDLLADTPFESRHHFTQIRRYFNYFRFFYRIPRIWEC